jgi:tRNA(Ile2) C34 agmatinyltransferase TiaS
MSDKKLWVDLSDDELQVLGALQAEMGLDSPNAVMHALIRQAHTRATIVCPACGHSAQVATQDEARCESCMSILRLSDQLWTVAASRVTPT